MFTELLSSSQPEPTKSAVWAWLETVDDSEATVQTSSTQCSEHDIVLVIKDAEKLAPISGSWTAEPMKLLLPNGEVKPLHTPTNKQPRAQSVTSSPATSEKREVYIPPQKRAGSNTAHNEVSCADTAHKEEKSTVDACERKQSSKSAKQPSPQRKKKSSKKQAAKKPAKTTEHFGCGFQTKPRALDQAWR